MQQKKDVVIFLRKKFHDQNSIEEIAHSLHQTIPNTKIEIFPEYPLSLRGIFRNIRFAMKHQGKINHLICPSDTYVGLFLRGKKMITWHDVGTALESHSKLRRLYRKLLYLYPTVFFDKIVCVSENTKSEVLEYLPFVRAKIMVINNPINRNFSYLPKTFHAACPRILHIGTAPRKNLTRVVEALAGMNCSLHIIGKLSDAQIELLKKYQVAYTNEYNIPFEEVVKRYQECDIVSFPSLYEGFGMIVIEANATGRPVLSSTIKTIVEVAGDSVLYVDPYHTEEIRAGFNQLISDAQLRSELVEAGLQNALKYSIEAVSGAYKDLYDHI